MNDELLQSAWQKMKAPLQNGNILDTTMSEIEALKRKYAEGTDVKLEPQ